MSKLITFEGIEGSGKSTQIRLLEEHLRGLEWQVVVTREPGGCRIADAIRHILLDPDNTQLASTAELLLYAAARAQHVAEVIRPALAEGAIVLCDRYIDATVAYQGYGRGLDLGLIEELNRLASDGVQPDLTLLFDLPVEEGLRRARSRNQQAVINEGRFEAESLAFHRRVRDGYLALAREERRFSVIDASGSREAVSRRLETAIQHFFSSAP